MDAKNRFHSPGIYQLVRADYVVVLAALVGVSLLHWREIDWVAWVVAFAWIDLVGYIPGTIYYHYFAKSDGGSRRSIPAGFYVAYNVAHSVCANAALVGVWLLASGSWSWAMLAPFIHLCIDRGVFGNIFKPQGLSFEPVAHPLSEKLELEYGRAGRW